MKSIIISSFILILSLSAQAGIVSVPDCKDVRGSVLNGTVDQLKVVMKSSNNRPQVLVSGIVTDIMPEDHNGLPHQKYTIKVDSQIKLLIVSNLDFGRVPLKIGQQLSVCGEFKKVGQGMVHWTHFDPHGGHPDGYTIVDGKLYGDVETPENR